jgi:hypothetical protein
MVRALGGELEASLDVFKLEIRKIGQYLCGTYIRRQHVEDIGHPYAHAANARLPPAFAGFGSNAIKQFR